ncbi:hypothetical protein OG223_41315 [Streptomyces sp. NBC_01478]|uniref:hypothetical protein n=1 Tax=Streptomyces sp. NBC_01478 TaxID=2903882 RepID=UPI002E3677EF|nr:hypothetical protein [Streptomyces sp. NBC_01478]
MLHGILAGLLFSVAFPFSGEPSLVSRQLALAVVGQALGVCWFTETTDPAYERLSTARPFVIAHLAMTVLLAVLLHGVQDGRTTVVVTLDGRPVGVQVPPAPRAPEDADGRSGRRGVR